MTRLILALLLLFFSSHSHATNLPFAEVDGGLTANQTAWWFRVTYNPDGKSIYNIPISKIDSSWCEAELLSPEKFPSEISDDIKRAFSDEDLAKLSKSSKMAFTTPQFSAGRYRHLVASAGVYRQCKSDKTGVFILVIDNKNIGKPKIIFKESFPDTNIAVLRVFPGKYLIVNWCYDCGDASRFWWKDGKFQGIPSDDAYDK
ncbi:MAG: hypothetical protein NTW68_12325 [candidate division NC10 bacterium]|nr:hypothetical protein [candidate division NC10 bacterium]